MVHLTCTKPSPKSSLTAGRRILASTIVPYVVAALRTVTTSFWIILVVSLNNWGDNRYTYSWSEIDELFI